MEIDYFIDHFKMLKKAGYKANLNLETKLGEVYITFNCKVGRVEPPLVSPSSSLISNRKLCRSLSYYRRQSRRRAERNTSNNVSCVIPESTAEQAEKKELADESCVVENAESDDASVVLVLKDASSTEKIETSWS